MEDASQEHLQGLSFMLWPPHRSVGIHAIDVAPPLLGSEEIALTPEVVEDAHHRALRQVQVVRGAPDGGVRVLEQVEENRRMVRK
jgi:hypothetical protein